MTIHHECAIRAALLVLTTIEGRYRTLAVVSAIKILKEAEDKDEA